MPANHHYLTEKLKEAPTGPGVYRFRDETGRIIYIGKAANLKKRLSSYFVKMERLDAKTGVLVGRMADFDTVVTATEKEALILEATLIRRHKPRYNVILKDDKRYPSLRLDVANQQYPALEVVRKIKKDGALYFGPFTSAGAVRQTLKVIDKTFRLRKCGNKRFHQRRRPCLNHQMDLCLAPCCRDIPDEAYREVVNEVVMFLRGRTPELAAKIKRDMAAAAERQDFETAAKLRDKMFAIEKVIEKQVAMTTDFADRDVMGFAEDSRSAVIVVLHVRGGFLVGTGVFPFDEVLSEPPEILSAFVRQYYEKDRFVPDEVLTAITPADPALAEDYLRSLKGKKVRLAVPQRGEKVRLVAMADKNAEKELENRRLMAETRWHTLEQLRKKMQMTGVPRRIECFDNSNLGGTNPVSAMAVFVDGAPAKDQYRRYRIKTADSRDDYACMAEVLERRYLKPEEESPYPDLLLVDGGKGQLNIAVAVLKALNLTEAFAVAAISKKDEQKNETADKIYLPGRANPVNFAINDPGFFLLQQIRDEAHRFAVGYQKTRRKQSAMASALDQVAGIGAKRKKKLLDHFGTLQNLRAADQAAIAALTGITEAMAEEIKRVLGENVGRGE
ncbi:MAG: excinuclease ABC subunit UvrC [Thermodesulfobacteriota bacterium]|nr:excinuclease ABC subunit UvrC [Thermodesulfobacteriota bacterium]